MRPTPTIGDSSGLDIAEIMTMAFITVSFISFFVGCFFQKWKDTNKFKEEKSNLEKESNRWKTRYQRLWGKLVKDGESWKYQ